MTTTDTSNYAKMGFNINGEQSYVVLNNNLAGGGSQGSYDEEISSYTSVPGDFPMKGMYLTTTESYSSNCTTYARSDLETYGTYSTYCAIKHMTTTGYLYKPFFDFLNYDFIGSSSNKADYYGGRTLSTSINNIAAVFSDLQTRSADTATNGYNYKRAITLPGETTYKQIRISNTKSKTSTYIYNFGTDVIETNTMFSSLTEYKKYTSEHMLPFSSIINRLSDYVYNTFTSLYTTYSTNNGMSNANNLMFPYQEFFEVAPRVMTSIPLLGFTSGNYTSIYLNTTNPNFNDKNVYLTYTDAHMRTSQQGTTTYTTPNYDWWINKITNYTTIGVSNIFSDWLLVRSEDYYKEGINVGWMTAPYIEGVQDYHLMKYYDVNDKYSRYIYNSTEVGTYTYGYSTYTYNYGPTNATSSTTRNSPLTSTTTILKDYLGTAGGTATRSACGLLAIPRTFSYISLETGWNQSYLTDTDSYTTWGNCGQVYTYSEISSLYETLDDDEGDKAIRKSHYTYLIRPYLTATNLYYNYSYTISTYTGNVLVFTHPSDVTYMKPNHTGTRTITTGFCNYVQLK